MLSFNRLAIERFLAEEFALLKPPLCSNILDLGCGSMPYRSIYAPKFTACVAADFEARGPIDVRLDAAHLPFKDSSFDVVLLSEVIEHIATPSRVIHEISRILRPGGVLLITWPFNYMMHEIPRDFTRITEFGMDHMLRSEGLTVERLLRRGNAFVVLFVMVEYLTIGGLEWLARRPIIGRIFSSLRSVLERVVFPMAHRALVALTWRRAPQGSELPGNDLSGVGGHLALWTLGYCALVRKPTGL